VVLPPIVMEGERETQNSRYSSRESNHASPIYKSRVYCQTRTGAHSIYYPLSIWGVAERESNNPWTFISKPMYAFMSYCLRHKSYFKYLPIMQYLMHVEPLSIKFRNQVCIIKKQIK
jgi:hypothetical protein